MKRTVLSLVIFLGSLITSYAQFDIGLRLAPTVAYSRIDDVDLDNFNVSNKGAGIGISFGPILEFEIGEHYSFQTGVWFTTKRTGLNIDSNTVSSAFDHKPVYNLQYLQIPVTMKFYTNKIANLLKIYVGLGGTIDWRIAEKIKDAPENLEYNKISKLVDFASYVSAGVELDLGGHEVYGGFVYSRGLLNMLSKNYKITDEIREVSANGLNNSNLSINNDLLGIELGVKL